MAAVEASQAASIAGTNLPVLLNYITITLLGVLGLYAALRKFLPPITGRTSDAIKKGTCLSECKYRDLLLEVLIMQGATAFLENFKTNIINGVNSTVGSPKTPLAAILQQSLELKIHNLIKDKFITMIRTFITVYHESLDINKLTARMEQNIIEIQESVDTYLISQQAYFSNDPQGYKTIEDLKQGFVTYVSQKGSHYQAILKNFTGEICPFLLLKLETFQKVKAPKKDKE